MFNNSSTTNNQPSKIAGQWHSTKGEVKQELGRTFGSADLEQKGREERIAGEAQYNAARAQGQSAGNRDFVVSSQDPAAVVGSQYPTGDRTQYAHGTQGQSVGASDRVAGNKDFVVGSQDPTAAVGSQYPPGDRTQYVQDNARQN